MKVNRTGLAVPTGPTGILKSTKRGPKAGGRLSVGKPATLQASRGQALSRRGR